MRKAMMEAEVGDDVFEEDPTVNALEDKVAKMFGFEAGLFISSGTMGNQLSVHLLTNPGDEILIEETGHIFNYEAAAASHLSSVQIKTIEGHKGKLSADLLKGMVRGDYDWEPKTSVVAIENSTNKGGGCCYSEEELLEIKSFADNNKLSVHLDGARIWNAMIATGTAPQFYSSIADTMSVAFSKGLGAPVGSILLSSRERIKKARRMRKMWGGGMRQIGILAAAADHGIEHHFLLLEEDHRRARELAGTIDECDNLSIDMDSVETNILIFDVEEMMAQSAVEKLEDEDILLVPFGPQTLRATFHFQITDEDLDKVQSVFRRTFN